MAFLECEKNLKREPTNVHCHFHTTMAAFRQAITYIQRSGCTCAVGHIDLLLSQL
jgi:hypothetical protein